MAYAISTTRSNQVATGGEGTVGPWGKMSGNRNTSGPTGPVQPNHERATMLADDGEERVSWLDACRVRR